MISLAGGPMRVGSGVAATGDWRAVVAVVVVIAIAFAAIAVVDYRTNKRQPSSKHESGDSERKAA
jgi:cyanate permease